LPGNFWLRKSRQSLAILSLSSRLAPLTLENFSRHSYGRVASITARELKPTSPRGIAESSGPLHARRLLGQSIFGERHPFKSVVAINDNLIHRRGERRLLFTH